MSHSIKIIVAGTTWCGFCKGFFEILGKVKETIKSSDVEGCKIDYEVFKLDESGEKQRFQNEYPGLSDYIEGYPTVFFQMQEVGSKERPKTELINHTVIKEKGDKGIEKASTEFIENIRNKYKSMKSGKSVFVSVQRGGMLNYMTTLEDENYRNKYLKYKSKYLNIKNKNN